MKLAETCVKYPVFTVMLIAFLVTLGVFSYRGLAVDLFPKADPATVNVEVRLPGATPEEVVTGVVLPLEDAISSVSGIDEINVYSFEGFEYHMHLRARARYRGCRAGYSRESSGSDRPAAARHAAAHHHQARPTIGSHPDATGEWLDEPPRVNGNRRQTGAPRDSDRGRRRKCGPQWRAGAANPRIPRCTEADRAQFHRAGRARSPATGKH